MARLIGLVKPLMGVMFFAVVTGLAGHLCASFITIFGGYAVLGLLGFDTPLSLRSIFGSVLVFAVLRSVLRYAEQSANLFIAFKLLARLRDKVFAALRKLCPAKLEGRDKGDLISVITSDIELLEVFYAHTISPAAIAFLYTIMMSLFIGSFHPALAALALLAYLTVGIVVPMITQNFGSKGQTTADAATTFRADSGNLSGFVLDNLRGLSETIQYGCGKERLIEMEKKTNALLESEKRIKCTTGRNMAVTNTIILAFDLCMLFVSAGLYQNGRLDFTGVVVPTIALFSSFAPSMALANLGSTLQNTFAAGNRVLGILDETPVVQEVRSGSGKSTLLKLFMRFWEVRDGTVTISGENINEVDTSQLRDMESFMTQETHLFQDSIKNNLRIAKLDATEEELEAACRKASVHDFIMGLPQGYDTPVGELGDTLSGGEKQRLGLARAFLHDASFLLLDEPTSNLDSLNEAVILKSLREERNGKTVLLVSHRQSMMRIADTIYDMESLSKTKGQVS